MEWKTIGDEKPEHNQECYVWTNGPSILIYDAKYNAFRESSGWSFQPTDSTVWAEPPRPPGHMIKDK